MRCSVRSFCAAVFCLAASPSLGLAAVDVVPSAVELRGNFDQLQLVVRDRSGEQVTDQSADLTRSAKYESTDANIVTVNETGLLRAVSNGEAKIRVVSGDQTSEVTVKVDGVAEQPSLEFIRDIAPILSKAGCNMVACFGPSLMCCS